MKRLPYQTLPIELPKAVMDIVDGRFILFLTPCIMSIIEIFM